MLRIERTDNGTAVIFRLSGRIGADELTELEAQVKAESAKKQVVLDLKDVTLVDLNAVNSLDRYETAKFELINAPAYIRAWIESERDQHPHSRGEAHPNSKKSN